MNNSEPIKKWPFTVTINDNFSVYECRFETSQEEVSIYDIATQIAEKLQCEVPEGKFLAP